VDHGHEVEVVSLEVVSAVWFTEIGMSRAGQLAIAGRLISGIITHGCDAFQHHMWRARWTAHSSFCSSRTEHRMLDTSPNLALLAVRFVLCFR
jgi:hypothetical protein